LPVKLITPRRIEDERGWFSETYHHQRLAGQGVEVVFCQDNHSLSRPAGVLRGLHFQTPPHAQAKLVRCVRGSIWDVAVDIRRLLAAMWRRLSRRKMARSSLCRSASPMVS
jgi:dTDP-4-dehydrorhamnose 3,5-epimerase